jgi:oligogalacturonide lyase
MCGEGRRPVLWTRRAVLTGLAGISLPAAADIGRPLPPDGLRFLDRATEFEVVRLTDPSYTSSLPQCRGRAFFRKRNAILYCSDREGSRQAYVMDLKTGVSRRMTAAAALDGTSLHLLPDERSCCYFDGPSMRRTNLGNGRTREVYRVPEGWERATGFSASGDGLHAFLVEKRNATYRIQQVALVKGGVRTVVESGEPLSCPMPRPKRAGVLYRRAADALWLVNYDGQQNRLLRTAPGGSGPAYWSDDGRTVFYLSIPADRRQLIALTEFTPDTNADALLAPTSQFVDFSPNHDGSVFVGASSSKASPYVLLLLRATRREFTLCEHRASDPSQVAPVFNPDSQQVLFQSDRDGKPAIYAIRVDRLVEKTED